MDNGRECGRAEMLIEQGSVVQKVYNSIHRINHYKGEFYFFLNVDLFGGLRYVHWETVALCLEIKAGLGEL